MGRKPKAIVSYISSAPATHEHTLEAYAKSPGSAFLSEAVHISDAANHCLRHFPARRSGGFTSDSRDSLYRISASLLASILGHFETFQRLLFAGIVEHSGNLNISYDTLCDNISKRINLTVKVDVLASYRGQPAPIGQVLAACLSGWHDPEKVNDYFKALLGNFELFIATDIEKLQVLWQLRHSIVHTASWITMPDAQKVQCNGPRKLGAQIS